MPSGEVHDHSLRSVAVGHRRRRCRGRVARVCRGPGRAKRASPAEPARVRRPRLADVPPPPRTEPRVLAPERHADRAQGRADARVRHLVLRPGPSPRAVAPLRRRSRQHRPAVPRSLHSSGRARAAPASRRCSSRTPPRWRSTTRSKRCASPSCGRCAACSIRWRWASGSSFVGAIGGHFASTVSIERLRRLNPLLSVSICQRLVPAADRTRRGAARCVRAHRHRHLSERRGPPGRRVSRRSAALRAAGDLDRRRDADAGNATLRAARRSAARSSTATALGIPLARLRVPPRRLCTSTATGPSSSRSTLRADAVPPGDAGATTLLTNLANHVQPLIRYDLGDRVTVHADALRLRIASAGDRGRTAAATTPCASARGRAAGPASCRWR